MNEKNNGINSTVWCGEVVEPLVFSHEITKKETNEVVERFYRYSLKTKVITNKGKELDDSILPIIVSEKHLNGLEKELEVGDVVFIRGSWRAYTINEENSRKVEQVGFVNHIVHSELKEGKYLNRFDFQGYLVDKLYIPVRDEETGKPMRDPETKKFIPLLDGEGNKQWTVRLNREKKVVNDYTIAINTNNRSFYIPSVSYFGLAKRVAEDFPLGSEVKGSGYVRSRSYDDGFGNTQTVYEAVVVALELVPQTEETEVVEGTETQE
ncbi:hypothetical protein [Bacillus thuringiensis]|uniref:hypothetical protein n=1 Tax=Bacillus thuringiensis TaxID=1428 RepID=UPI0021D6688C|nr:hypothetical protein [Bacillus thuringiensis]MCU7667036.1 hypothetical protein [Bacillus thuringiensis]